MCENTIEELDDGRFIFEDGKIIDTYNEIPPIKLDFGPDDGSEPDTIDSSTLRRWLNENVYTGGVSKVCVACEDEVPKMSFMFQDEATYHENHMFRQIQEMIDFEDEPHLLYVFFNMGSVILDTSNPCNQIQVYSDFVECYNADKFETTLIKLSEVTGFVFEPRKIEEIAEEMNENLEEKLREELGLE